MFQHIYLEIKTNIYSSPILKIVVANSHKITDFENLNNIYGNYKSGF